MLTKLTLRALSPGRWARVRVPDYECWRTRSGHPCYAKPGDEVDVCVLPGHEAR
jgi:hypothetical protein